jgi:F-type H+-transporting ATPase subunit gamma
MEAAEQLRRAIGVTEELHSVVKTMKALAGVNIRQYERAAHAVAEYFRTIQMGLQVALSRMPPHAIPPRYAKGRKLGAIVFGSDQGMCGQLNDQIVNYALRALGKLAKRRDDQAIVAVGARAASKLDAEGRALEATVDVPASINGINAAVEQVVRKVEEWHSERSIETVVLFSARPVSGAWYRTRGTQLLPVDAQWINALRVKPWPSKVLPTFTIDEARLFRLLIREYLFVSLFRAFAESLASENASRLASMQVAEKNIETRLANLNISSRQLRQETITAELLDIIASFEAMQGKPGKRHLSQ